MLSIRKKGRYYTVRGTVRVGRETHTVAEHSTGTDRRADAQEYAGQLEEKIRHRALYPEKEKQTGITFGKCVDLYIKRPEKISTLTLYWISELLKYFEHTSIPEIQETWSKFISERCSGLKPSTANRFRSVLNAVLNYASESRYGFQVPKIKPLKMKQKLVRFLLPIQQTVLLNSYPAYIRGIFFIYCFCGVRTQEALQLDWNDISFEMRTIRFRRTKNGHPRIVPMHKKVFRELKKLYEKRGRPKTGHVFLNSRGHPYQDTREAKWPGGNPLRSVHKTALKRANAYLLKKGYPEIGTFRIHDWRHHFGSWADMKGISRQATMEIGGWISSSSLDQYASVNVEHLRNSLEKLK